MLGKLCGVGAHPAEAARSFQVQGSTLNFLNFTPPTLTTNPPLSPQTTPSFSAFEGDEFVSNLFSMSSKFQPESSTQRSSMVPKSSLHFAQRHSTKQNRCKVEGRPVGPRKCGPRKEETIYRG